MQSAPKWGSGNWTSQTKTLFQPLCLWSKDVSMYVLLQDWFEAIWMTVKIIKNKQVNGNK